MSDTAESDNGPFEIGVQIKGRIGTDAEQLREWAEAVVDRSESIECMEIADLRALIEAVQDHPRAVLLPHWNSGDPMPSRSTDPPSTYLRLVDCIILSADLGATDTRPSLEVRLTLCVRSWFCEPVRCIGTRFVGFARLSNSRFMDIASFESAVFVRSVFFTKSRFAKALNLDRVAVMDELRLDWAVCEKAVSFRSSQVLGRLSFQEARFQEDVQCQESRFAAEVAASKVVINGKFDATNAVFDGYVSVMGGEIGALHLDSVHSTQGMSMSDCVISGEASFAGMVVPGGLVLKGCMISGPSSFSKFQSRDRLCIIDTSFKQWVSFDHARIEGRLDWSGTVFHAGVSVAHLSLPSGPLGPVDLKRWDLATVDIYYLDGHDLREVRFPPKTREAWHTLRREYTGTRLFFHLLLTSLFFGVHAARTFMWVGVNRAQAAIKHGAEKLDAAASGAQAAHPEAALAISAAARELAEVSRSLTLGDRRFQVWELMLGLDRGWIAAALAFALLAYNVGRLWLTREVGTMRDESDRSGFAPLWTDYILAWKVHDRLMRWLLWVAVVSFVWHAWGWLRTPVWLLA